jgi:sugar lactone lactonase YvrE
VHAPECTNRRFICIHMDFANHMMHEPPMSPHSRRLLSFLLPLALLSACAGADPAVNGAGPVSDAAIVDAQTMEIAVSDVVTSDAAAIDAPVDTMPALDAVRLDAEISRPDASRLDAASPDLLLVDVRLDITPDITPDVAPSTFLPAYPLSARFPEGGTYDPRAHRFFVGSLADGSVHTVNATTGVESVLFRETAPGRWWTLGMDVDVDRRRLAVCAMDDRRALSETGHPYDGYVWVFDIDTGARVARYPLSGAFATATCTDVAWAADGGMYVCDREHPKIYHISASGTLTTFVTNSLLAGGVIGQNAVVVLPDQSALLSLIYLPSRLVRIGLRDRSVTDVSLRGTFFDGLPLLSGADGMTLSGSSLFVAFTSQVTRVTPTLADWSAASTATVDVPAGMTDIVHTSAGDYLLNGQAVSFAFDRTPEPFRLVRFVGTF